MFNLHKTVIFGVLALLSTYSQLFSQNTQQSVVKDTTLKTTVAAKNPAIKLKTRIQKDRISFRWAVDDPGAWRECNKSGFKVFRYKVYENDKQVTNSEQELLTPQPLKPRPLMEWRDIVQRDNMAAIMAQALYGESFSTTDNKSKEKKSLSDILEKNEELTQRFTFSLMAADQSFEAALMAGWGFVDSTAKPNIQYQYTIVPITTKVKIDKAHNIVGLSDYVDLPQPTGLLPQFSNKSVMLSWDYKTLVSQYNRYDVERSEDSINFKKVNKLPVTILNTENDVTERMFYTDSLEANDKIYYYRIRGVSTFGELSPPSEVVRGKGYEIMGFAPNFTDAKITTDTTATLYWDIMKDTVDLIEYFEISQSNNADGNYQIVKTNIDKTARSTEITGLWPTNYYVIAGVDKYGKKIYSYPYLVQPIDSIPPTIPTGLSGTANDSGRIDLKWLPNTEKDIYGYYVYRCNVKGEEMSILTKEPLRSTVFVDSVSLLMTNPKVYYAIAAVDQRYNQSKISEPIAIVKPDKIPPISPAFTSYKLGDERVTLNWQSSPSEDVAFQRIYKKEANNTEGVWTLVKEFTGVKDTMYVDSTVMAETKVHYTIIAIDNSKNESVATVPLTVTVVKDKKNVAAVSNLKGEALRPENRINLEWQHNEKGIVEYQVYKSTGTKPFSLWKVLEQSNNKIADVDVVSGHVYKYAVRAVFNDGRMSAWKEIFVEF
jgi:uncharacterized protein